MIKLAIDLLGSDLGEEELIEGVKSFLKDHDDIILHLFGNEELLKKHFNTDKIVIHNVSKFVPMEVGALQFLRMKDTSMYQAISSTMELELDGVVSAGSTGGFLTGATLIIKNIPGVHRAGFCAPFLTLKEGKQIAILDIGASNINTPEDLLCFGRLGNVYAKKMWNIEKPSVYLLNNGVEKGKGPDEVKNAYTLFEQCENINFKGNIEAREVMSGEADVVVTSGFPGNIYLKASEGMAKNMSLLLNNAFRHSLMTKISYLLVRKQIKRMKEIMNYKKVGGALTLGLNKVVVKAHGNSDAYSFYHAIDLAYRMASVKMTEAIKKEFE